MKRRTGCNGFSFFNSSSHSIHNRSCRRVRWLLVIVTEFGFSIQAKWTGSLSTAKRIELNRKEAGEGNCEKNSKPLHYHWEYTLSVRVWKFHTKDGRTLLTRKESVVCGSFCCWVRCIQMSKKSKKKQNKKEGEEVKNQETETKPSTNGTCVCRWLTL